MTNEKLLAIYLPFITVEDITHAWNMEFERREKLRMANMDAQKSFEEYKKRVKEEES